MADVLPPRLIALVPGNGNPVCVMLPGAGGGPAQYLGLAASLAGRYRVFAMRAAGLFPGERPETSIEEMADATLAELERAQLVPDLVLGWSMGGTVGWELCLRLAERGVTPALALVDSSPLPHRWPPAALGAIRDKSLSGLGNQPDETTVARVEAVLTAHLGAVDRYRAQRPYPGRTLALMCEEDPHQERDAALARWRELAPDLTEASLSGGHLEALEPQRLDELSAKLSGFLSDTARAGR